ncbi:MAG: hypothetical protein K2O18_03575 [Oscillospiraceae bacterium]|nr:hypothetical protein [Oscillospiraceae bacterium]
MKDLFTNWLKTDNAGVYSVEWNDSAFSALKVRKNDVFEYIFVQKNSGTDEVTRLNHFVCFGIYNKKSGQLYDVQPTSIAENLFAVFGETEELRIIKALDLKAQLERSVREKAEAMVGNDRSKLAVSEFSDSAKVAVSYLKEQACQTAVSLFLDSTLQLPPVSFEYAAKSWSEKSILSYITDPSGYVEEEAKRALANPYYQEKMLLAFLLHDEIRKAYDAISTNPDDPMHVIKKIRNTVKDVSSSTVQVTILKDGIEFSFKTQTFDLKNYTGVYNAAHISAKDKKAMRDLFGGTPNYTPQEIIRIKTGRKVLYEA